MAKRNSTKKASEEAPPAVIEAEQVQTPTADTTPASEPQQPVQEQPPQVEEPNPNQEPEKVAKEALSEARMSTGNSKGPRVITKSDGTIIRHN